MSETFRSFIRDLVQRVGTAGEIAEALGMSHSAFSRGVRIEGSLGVDKVLLLAEYAGRDPFEVLRLAQKGHIADVIERMFGAANQASAPEMKMLEAWRSLDMEKQQASRDIIFWLARRRP